MATEIYFILANETAEPYKMVFNKDEAFLSGAAFIDSFDTNGTKLVSYYLENGDYVEEKS